VHEDPVERVVTALGDGPVAVAVRDPDDVSGIVAVGLRQCLEAAAVVDGVSATAAAVSTTTAGCRLADGDPVNPGFRPLRWCPWSSGQRSRWMSWMRWSMYQLRPRCRSRRHGDPQK